jgi:hypothetical protein
LLLDGYVFYAFYLDWGFLRFVRALVPLGDCAFIPFFVIWYLLFRAEATSFWFWWLLISWDGWVVVDMTVLWNSSIWDPWWLFVFVSHDRLILS